MKSRAINWAVLSFSCAFLSLCLSDVKGDVLWNNGPLVTHPGAGPDGADVSMASVVPNTAGSNLTAAVWRADNFTVDGPGWLVENIQAFAYDTNFADPRFESATIRIHESNGGTPGVILASANATWAYSGINRIFNLVTTGSFTNTARQVQTLTANFGNFALTPGDYFFSYSVTNTTGGNNWFPYVMDINPDDPDNPITRIGNSLVSTNSGDSWSTAIVTSNDWNQSPEIPFVINGTAIPEPTQVGLLMAGLVALFARRRS